MPTWLVSQAAAQAHRLVREGLATSTAIDRIDVVATISGLVVRGFVDRIPDSADRRRNVVSITPPGRTHLRRLDELLVDVQRDFLGSLTAAERRTLERLLTGILEYHDDCDRH